MTKTLLLKVKHENTTSNRRITSGMQTTPCDNLNEINTFDRVTGELTLNFTSKDSKLHIHDLQDLRNFLDNKSESHFIVEGHGEKDSAVAQKKAEAVATFIKKRKKGARVTTVECGSVVSISKTLNEVTSKAVIYQGNPITKALEKLSAHHYLIDSTESMEDNLGNTSKWSQVLMHVFPSNSNIYLFNTDFKPQTLEEARTKGNTTPLLSALHELIDQANPGDTITIISNGSDNASDAGHNYDTVINQATRKEVKISVIGLELNQLHKNGLRQIAQNTNSKWYLVN